MNDSDGAILLRALEKMRVDLRDIADGLKEGSWQSPQPGVRPLIEEVDFLTLVQALEVGHESVTAARHALRRMIDRQKRTTG